MVFAVATIHLHTRVGYHLQRGVPERHCTFHQTRDGEQGEVMGYYTQLNGGFEIQPPLTWTELALVADKMCDSKTRTVWVELETREQKHVEGTLVIKQARHVKVYDGSVRAHNTEKEIGEIVAAFPGHTFTGLIEGDGEESGDQWRMYIVDGKVIKHTVLQRWPDPPKSGEAI